MASLADSNSIQCTEETINLLSRQLSSEQRILDVKGRGQMQVYCIESCDTLDPPACTAIAVKTSESPQSRPEKLSFIPLFLRKIKHFLLVDHNLGSFYTHAHYEYWTLSSGVISIVWLIYPVLFFWISDLVLFSQYAMRLFNFDNLRPAARFLRLTCIVPILIGFTLLVRSRGNIRVFFK